MTLRLRLKTDSKLPIDATGILPSRLAGQSLDDIRRIGVWQGNRQLPLAELFDVQGSLGGERIAFEGDLSSVHAIGADLDGGEIQVEGHAGRRLGAQMTAGAIRVQGDVGDFAGQAMRGGTVQIAGNAGQAVGGPLPGVRRGMTGGWIFISGRAGDQLGRGMRRGLIVAGAAGDFAGAYLLAGTIVVLGSCGARPGASMRRGTLVLMSEAPPLLPTFQFGCVYRPPFLRALLKELRRLEAPIDGACDAAEYALHHGDALEAGRGEILIRQR